MKERPQVIGSQMPWCVPRALMAVTWLLLAAIMLAGPSCSSIHSSKVATGGKISGNPRADGGAINALGIVKPPWPAPMTQTFTGQWIWQPAAGPANTWIAFRKTVSLSKPPASVKALIAADTKYWLWINGRAVVFEGSLKRGPNPSDSYVDEVDIGPYLVDGNNTIASLVWYFGKSAFSSKDSGQGGFMFQASAGATTIASDETWKMKVHSGYGPQTLTAPNFRLAEWNVEYDGRAELGDWTVASFVDSSWAPASAKGAPPAAPWGRLWPRGIPQWRNSGVKDYTNQSSLPVTGGGGVIRARLPYNAQVTPYLHVKAAAAGAVILMQTDRLNEGGASVQARYITRAGEQEYESLGWMSGNEVQYTIPAGVEIVKLGYRETGYDTDLTAGAFSSSDASLNTLWTKAQRTLYINMRDNYMDCPTRERALWWGDAVIEIGQTFYAMDRRSDLLSRNAINTLIGWQRSDKTIFAPVPGRYAQELPVQMLASVGMAGFWNYYLHTGDRAALIAAYPHVKDYLSVWTVGSNGLVDHRAGGWDWEDWGKNIDAPLLDNAWYYMALDSAAHMADVLGNTAEASAYRATMATLKPAFVKQFWNGTRLASPGHTGAPDDRGNGLAVVAGLLGAAEWPAVKAVLAANTEASPYMEKYILESYFRMGDPQGGLDRMRARYGPMIRSTTTTLWEHWDPKAGTENHAWSGGPLTLMSEYIAGVAPTSAGYATFQVLPLLGDLTRASVTVPSIKGAIKVDVSRSTGAFTLMVTAPAGTAATVGIPLTTFAGGPSSMRVTANGTQVFDAGKFAGALRGVSDGGNSAGFLRFNVTPGNWTFIATAK
ncbi:MAG: alpha-L-rhamnosidase C-terminal domain-containing protein [Steroidobacteraceae bacterium]